MDKNILRAKLEEIKKSNPELNSSKKEYPSTTEMAKNLIGSVVRNVQSVASGNPLKITKEEASSRLNVCKACSFFDASKERCKKCGCNMAVKTYLKAEKCPLNKW